MSSSSLPTSPVDDKEVLSECTLVVSCRFTWPKYVVEVVHRCMRLVRQDSYGQQSLGAARDSRHNMISKIQRFRKKRDYPKYQQNLQCARRQSAFVNLHPRSPARSSHQGACKLRHERKNRPSTEAKKQKQNKTHIHKRARKTAQLHKKKKNASRKQDGDSGGKPQRRPQGQAAEKQRKHKAQVQEPCVRQSTQATNHRAAAERRAARERHKEESAVEARRLAKEQTVSKDLRRRPARPKLGEPSAKSPA